MKKLLFLISFLFIQPLFADSITSGVGLTLPTTGVIDVSKSWATKYNENFNVIASTIATNITDINSINSTLTTRFGNVATDTATLKIRLDNVAVATTSISGNISSYSSFTLTLDGGEISVSVSTSSFDPFGVRYVTGISTLNLTAVRFYTVTPSTVGATNFRISYTTTTNVTPSTWSYITSQVAVSTNAVFSDWASLVGNVINSGEKISLHITSVPLSGTPNSKFGAIIRYWRKNE